MRVLELFFGDGSFSKEAVKYPDMRITGVDIIERPEWIVGKMINYMRLDVLELPPRNFNHHDIVWASPPCDTFSTGGYPAKHRRKDKGTPRHGEAVSDKAKLHDEYVLHTLNMIQHIEPRFWVIENPRGLLRKMSYMQGIPRMTVCYCQYGDDRMKPTDLFGVFPNGFVPKMCKNNNPDCDHTRSPRGAKTGTQGLPRNMRARVPSELCAELIQLMRDDQ